ncbi:MAG TPA: hypothetical protein VMK13_06610 [Streptosporangiaceae bacterium]|nr:hypothetical protein [Streptosporangiaceae bacterium]
MSQVPARIARIAAITARTPVLISAAATAATANVISWELRRVARSPLTPEARRLDRHFRELAARPRRPAAAVMPRTEITEPFYDSESRAA